MHNKDSNMRVGNWIVAVGGALSMATALAAPVVGWTTIDNTVYATTNGFESAGALANNTVLSNQFNAEGISFTGAARANGCGSPTQNGWTTFGMAGQNYVNSFGPGCTTNNTIDNFSIKFGSDVSRLAFDANNYNGSGDDQLQLLDDGVVVGTYTMSSLSYAGLAANSSTQIGSRYFSSGVEHSGILMINGNGGKFDELRFVESTQGASYGNYWFLDNLRYDAANSVPEPGSVALALLALLGAGAATRQGRRQASRNVLR
jgi:hypothetical protein